MYVLPVCSQIWILDRDEKRVGKYMELDRVLAPNRVSHSVRRISISVHQEKNEYLKDNIEYTKMEEWPGKNIDILI